MLCVSRISCRILVVFFFNDTATTEIYTLSLHDALPISCSRFFIYPTSAAPKYRSLTACSARTDVAPCWDSSSSANSHYRSEEHTSELQSRLHLVCRLLLEKKKKRTYKINDVRSKEKHRS